MEASLTGSPIDSKNTDVLVVDVEVYTNEYITAGDNYSKINKAIDELDFYLKEERKTEAYQETLNIDIENIDNIDNNHKHHKTPWRKIYKVIQQEFFEETEIFLEQF